MKSLKYLFLVSTWIALENNRELPIKWPLHKNTTLFLKSALTINMF